MEHVLLTIKDRVATLELNRPEALNALNEPMLAELLDKLKIVEDSDVAILLMKGKGKGFSAGGDIRSMLQSTNEHSFIGIMETIKQLIITLYRLPKLTISYLHGPAAGLGFSLALACDYVIATEEARLAMNFIGIGLIPDGGGHFFLEKRLGEAKAKQVIWEGKVMTAEEALRLGLIDAITNDDTVENKVKEWLNKPIQAMIATKQIYTQLSEEKLLQILDLEAENQKKMRQTKDHVEGIRAFLEKRQPNFIGQ
jgi:2-(1,2-epoxy-1,2-dihydrophenyl)acetyl-CoA isomerase